MSARTERQSSGSPLPPPYTSGALLSSGTGRRKLRRLVDIRRDIPAWLYVVLGGAVVAGALLMWSAVTYSGLINPLFLPPPTAVLERGIELAASGVLWDDTRASLYRISMGFFFSCLFAVPIGVLMGTYRAAEAVFEPPVGLIRYMPVVAFVPLTILWVGINDPQKFLIVFLGTFFQQVLMVSDNVKSVRMELINVGQTLGLGNLAILRRIILPAAAPAIWDSLRVTLGWAWTYLVVAELVAASSGLGFRIMQAQRFFQTETIILGIVVIGLLGLISDMAFKIGNRLFFSWAKESR